MKNPLDQFRSSLFGTRGCDIALALQYVDELASASTDAVAVQTAARVLLNTCANAVAQVVDAPSPERLALIDLIDERIDAHKLILADQVSDKVTDWMSDKVTDWMSDNLESYIDDNVNIEEKINNWMDDNLADKINDLDLVVRIR